MATRIHLIGLPHTQANDNYTACAYTQRHVKFSKMMTAYGYEVISYAGEHSDCGATENVVVASDKDQAKWFGEFDYHNNFFPITWDSSHPHWVEMNAKVVAEMSKRIRQGDIICIVAGYCQKILYDLFGERNPVVEYAIGYRGCFANFKAFESYSHMHWVYGSMLNSDSGKHYDVVIPNHFDDNDFYISNDRQNYHVFLGRFIERKGVEIAVEASRRLGVELIMAGQGCKQDGTRFYNDSGFEVHGDHIKHIGHVDKTQRAKLLADAKLTYMPTTYLEPFGGVSVESLFSGTPVIASDFGAFVEQIKQGRNGYRFRTIGEATEAARNIENLEWSADEIRADAIQRYGLKKAVESYDDFFQQILGAFYGGADFYSDWHGRTSRYDYPYT